MKQWNFKVFITPRGANEIQDWLQGLPPKVCLKIRTGIKYLETEKIWPSNLCHKIIGYEKIYELLFYYGNVQYRPLCCFGPKKKEFTLLIPAIEHGDRFEPKTAPETAVKRYKLIHEEEGHTDDFI